MTYTETLAKLATDVERQVAAAYAAHEAGRLTETEFVAVAAAFVAAGANRGTGLADVALAATVSTMTSRPVPTVGVLPASVDHAGPVRALLARDDLPDVGARLGTHARAETLSAAQDAYGEAMTRQGVPAWTRVLNSGACELCQDLAGDVLPGDAPMYHHKGCGCTQRPVLNQRRESA